MEMIKYAAIALMLSAASVAAQDECYQAEPALESMAENGYTITFGDTSGDWAIFMTENGKGGWAMFALRGDTLCPIAGGEFGIHTPLPPNT